MNNLRRIRRNKDLTQYELSRRTGISQSTLSLIERFFKEPNLEMVRKISNGLRCHVDEVFPSVSTKNMER